jgi:hypothetical protein
MRIQDFLICAVLTGASLCSGQSLPPRGQTPATQGQAAPLATINKANHAAPADLPPDAVVIAVHGVCAAEHNNDANCVTNITREQFERMLSAMSFNAQLRNNRVATRAFAESFAEALILADSAEKAALDKDPSVQELMNIVRVRTLADAYRRLQQQEAQRISPEEIEAYYKENAASFDEAELDRIFIPRISSKQTSLSSADFERKAHQLAEQVRERAAKGEDMARLQIEAYQSLGLTPPMTTDMGAVRRSSLPPASAQEVFSKSIGEVTKVLVDASGFTFYKVRSRRSSPTERVKDEIAHTLAQKKFAEATHASASRANTEMNEQFFGSRVGAPTALSGTDKPSTGSNPRKPTTTALSH